MKIKVKLKEGMIEPKIIGTCVDKLYLTCNVPVEWREDIIANLSALNEIAGPGPLPIYKHSRWISVHPKIESYVDPAGSKNLLVQCDPKLSKSKYSNVKFIRCEWTPSKVVAEFVAEAIESLHTGLYHHLMKNATVTRIDVAVDVKYLSVHRNLFLLPRISITKVNMKSGKTLKLGGSKANHQLTIYDKRAQIKEENSSKPAEMKQPVPKDLLTRLEFVLTPSNTKLASIPAMPNPFGPLIISSPSMLEKGDDQWRLFMFAAQMVGVQAAAQIMTSTTTQKAYKKRIKAGAAKWWKPNDVWSKMPSLVGQIIHALPKPTVM